MRFVRRILSVAILCVFATEFEANAQQVRINEIFADNETNTLSDGTVTDWVELYNTSAGPIDLTGYSLTDASGTPRKWVFPNGVTIPANGYLLILLDSSRPASVSSGPLLNTGFSVRATGDEVELYTPTTQLVEAVRFGPQAADYTIGRIPSGTGNFVLTRPTPGAGNAQQPLGSQATLRINEWMASPGDGDDWFEIFNPDPLPVQLTGLYFTDINNEPSHVAPFSYIGTGLDGFLQIFADNNTNDNEVNFGLGGSGDSIGLYFANGSQIDRVQFGQQATDISQGRMPDGSGNIQSLSLPTPDESNLMLFPGLVVNEVLSHTDPPFEDAVEFYNQTDAPIDIGGWYLSNSRNDLRRYRIPAGWTVPARGYFVLYEYQFNGPAATTPFTFSSSQGDQVYLSQAVNDQLTGAVVTESFEPAENGVSFGRHQTSVPGDYKFVAMTSPTFGVNNPSSLERFRTGAGAPNSGPRVGPIVIHEVMYHPLSPDGGVTDNTIDEFIELLNLAGASIPLFDPNFPTNRWVLRGGVNFAFPVNTDLSPYGAALVVSFDPADAGLLSAFRAKYSIPQTVPVYGPYLGRLGNAGDEVELYKPDPPEGPTQPDAGFVPYIRVDKVNYSDVAPWPAAADGTGMSLQKVTASAFGNDPINWAAAAPTAGQGGVAPVLRIHAFAVVASTPVMEFNATPGTSYTVEYTDSLQPGSIWTDLISTNATASDVLVQDPTAGGTTQRFYRVTSP